MTTALYLEDAYKTSCETEVIKVEGNKVFVKETVFYPTGGGQECDTGVIVQDGSVFEVEKVKKEQGKIVHYIKDGALVKLGPVKLEIPLQNISNCFTVRN